MRESPPSGSARRSTVAARSSSHGRRGARMPVGGCRGDEVAHEPLLVVRAEVAVVLVGLGAGIRLPHDGGAEPELGDLRLRGLGLVARPASRVPRLEGHQPARSGLRDAAAGERRVEHAGDGVADDVVGVRDIRHAQRDAEVGVGAQVVLDDARRPLRRHDQVDAERATALGDVDDAVDELGDLAGQGRELVDDEHERGRGLGVLPLLELEQVLRLLAVEQVLAVVQLGAQARERASHEVRAQVGDEADAVRQVDAVGERGPALVVHEEERDPVGAVLRRHAEHPSLQELGLAGSRRAADERVRALRAEVERHRVGAALADERLQRAGPLQPGTGAAPAVEDRVVLPPAFDGGLGLRGEVGAEQAQERHAPREVAGVGRDRARVDDRGETLREHLGVLVGDALDDDRLDALRRRGRSRRWRDRGPRSASTKVRHAAGSDSTVGARKIV